jgi:hypothetical protein
MVMGDYFCGMKEGTKTIQQNLQPMSQEVFLVTRGDYSEYRVCAVFSEKALAKKYVDSFQRNSYEQFMIEKYTLNPYQYELKRDYKPFFLIMTREGNCIEINIKNSPYGFEDEDINISIDRNNNMHISIFAKDETHAIKIANEKRVQLIAGNRWE